MDNMKFKRGGGRNSQHFVCSAAKIVENFNSLNQPKVKAFTLAEVLITLAIIGVVAALTIPSVVASYKKQQTVTKLKKTYTTLSQAINMAAKDHGPIQNWEVENERPKEFVDKYVAPYLNVAKNCGYGTTGDCEFKWAVMKTPSKLNVHNDKRYKLLLNDGVSLVFDSYVGNDTFAEHPYREAHVDVYVDINGQKEPNVYGKDIFIFTYYVDANSSANVNGVNYTGKFVPTESLKTRQDALNYCAKNKSGKTCATLIMTDGWQIKDDYPW